MNEAQALDFMRDAIWTLIIVVAPVMLVGLVVGLIISLFQALTSIQEMTLTFVPKILLVFMSLVIFLPFMLETMRLFMEGVADKIIGLGTG
ncbi:MAG: flagellar biosynthetic protein FliQ [Rhodospirillaceae bacterium]|nr:flagellar biosynthetic protein FliQ [Rhodospirillaceae bacterium]|tara:strand:+ start:1112 stop:1384 length:273 start_codon:yes stop_codon:yes gene_type:complete